MEEYWLPVVGWEEAYEVSNHGRVRRSAAGPGTHVGKVLSPGHNSSGRCTVNLHWSGRHKSALVHQLVAQAFIPNPNGLPMVLHWDDDPDNNRTENLRWGNKSDNMKDAIRNGRWVSHESQKTHCPRSHPYDKANTYRSPNRPNARMCRTCHHEKYIARKERR